MASAPGLVMYFAVVEPEVPLFQVCRDPLRVRPAISCRVPVDDRAEVQLPSSIADFCFPVGGCQPVVCETAPPLRSHAFVMTTGEAEFLYGVALITHEECAEGSMLGLRPSKRSESLWVPKALCVLSRFPFFRALQQTLHALIEFKAAEQDVPVERVLTNIVEEVAVPPRGGPSVSWTIGSAKLSCEQPPASCLPLQDFSLRYLFRCFTVAQVVQLMFSLLGDCKVVLVSSYAGLLTIVAESLRGLLFPFTWHHIYAPLCPAKYASRLLEASLPYLIGVLDQSELVLPGDVVQVYVDQGVIRFPGDVPPLLPPSRALVELQHKVVPVLDVFSVHVLISSSSRMDAGDGAGAGGGAKCPSATVIAPAGGGGGGAGKGYLSYASSLFERVTKYWEQPGGGGEKGRNDDGEDDDFLGLGMEDVFPADHKLGGASSSRAVRGWSIQLDKFDDDHADVEGEPLSKAALQVALQDAEEGESRNAALLSRARGAVERFELPEGIEEVVALTANHCLPESEFEFDSKIRIYFLQMFILLLRALPESLDEDGECDAAVLKTGCPEAKHFLGAMASTDALRTFGHAPDSAARLLFAHLIENDPACVVLLKAEEESYNMPRETLRMRDPDATGVSGVFAYAEFPHLEQSLLGTARAVEAKCFSDTWREIEQEQRTVRESLRFLTLKLDGASLVDFLRPLLLSRPLKQRMSLMGDPPKDEHPALRAVRSILRGFAVTPARALAAVKNDLQYGSIRAAVARMVAQRAEAGSIAKNCIPSHDAFEQLAEVVSCLLDELGPGEDDSSFGPALSLLKPLSDAGLFRVHRSPQSGVAVREFLRERFRGSNAKLVFANMRMWNTHFFDQVTSGREKLVMETGDKQKRWQDLKPGERQELVDVEKDMVFEILGNTICEMLYLGAALDDVHAFMEKTCLMTELGEEYVRIFDQVLFLQASEHSPVAALTSGGQRIRAGRGKKKGLAALSPDEIERMWKQSRK